MVFFWFAWGCVMYIKKSSNITNVDWHLIMNDSVMSLVLYYWLKVNSYILFWLFIVSFHQQGWKVLYLFISPVALCSVLTTWQLHFEICGRKEKEELHTPSLFGTVVQLSCGAMRSCVCLRLLLPMIRALPVAAVFEVPMPKSHRV